MTGMRHVFVKLTENIKNFKVPVLMKVRGTGRSLEKAGLVSSMSHARVTKVPKM